MNLRLLQVNLLTAATAAGFLGLGLGIGSAVSHSAPAGADVTSVTQCQPGANPCVGWQDPGGTSCVPDLELADHNGWPIWWVLNCGGMWSSDKLGVTGSSVTNRVAYLWSPDGVHGALVIDGQTLTGADIAMVHLMRRAHLTFADMQWLARHG